MLSPRSRRLLLDGLRPPPGYAFERAVGTSYTLDLMALMTAPLAFTFFDWEDGEGKSSVDPLALFEALRRHADRIALFCQAGRIAVPPTGRLLLQYLEASVFEAAAPREAGLFHPKVWLLRYTAPDEPARYRLLCLTRNLTFDRSWDTALVLDGVLGDRKKAFAANHPLGDFIAALPGLAVRTVPDETRASIEAMAEEVRRVSFELPEGFDEYAFHPLGLGGTRRRVFHPADESRRLLVVSPFVSDGMLEELAVERGPGILISRPESLDALKPATLALFAQVFVLHPSADPEDEDEPGESAEGAASKEDASAAETAFSGLHAKLYVMDDGWDARVWTGSANATDAAFERNVEFLVELVGKKSVCGIDALLGAEDTNEATLRGLLMPFSAGPGPSDDELQAQRLEIEVERVTTALSRLSLVAQAEERDADGFSLALHTERAWPDLPEDLRLSCRPVTVGVGSARVVEVGNRELGRFEPLTADALTQFFAFEATLRRGGLEKCGRFVVNVPLIGAPADRRDRVLRQLLRNSEQVLRLIWLLLADADVSVQDWVEVGTGTGAGPWRSASAGGFPVLETMLRALDRDPAKLDEVAKLVADLRRTPEGAQLLPPGFDAIWEPIWKTREDLR